MASSAPLLKWIQFSSYTHAQKSNQSLKLFGCANIISFLLCVVACVRLTIICTQIIYTQTLTLKLNASLCPFTCVCVSVKLCTWYKCIYILPQQIAFLAFNLRCVLQIWYRRWFLLISKLKIVFQYVSY